MSEKKSSSSKYVIGRRLWVPKDLYKAIEQHASQRGQTVGQWVEEAVREDMKRLKEKEDA